MICSIGDALAVGANDEVGDVAVESDWAADFDRDSAAGRNAVELRDLVRTLVGDIHGPLLSADERTLPGTTWPP